MSSIHKYDMGVIGNCSFLAYDGTLVPIIKLPEQAFLTRLTESRP